MSIHSLIFINVYPVLRVKGTLEHIPAVSVHNGHGASTHQDHIETPTNTHTYSYKQLKIAKQPQVHVFGLWEECESTHIEPTQKQVSISIQTD